MYWCEKSMRYPHSLPNSFLVIAMVLVASVFSSFHIGLQAVSFPDEPYEYHCYDSMTRLLKNLSMDHADIMSLTSIGTTYEGRDIWLVKISKNVTVNEQEPAVLLIGAHHGNELPSYESLIFFIEYVLQSYANQTVNTFHASFGLVDEDAVRDTITQVVDAREMYIIPMVNPDGVEYGWRKNRAPNYGSFGNADSITSYGVDLNRNYDFNWNLPFLLPLNYMLPFIIRDSSWNYRGEHPFSENETKAVRDFVLVHPNIKISLSYHSYSEVILYPWMHTSLPAPDEDLFLSVGENISLIDGYDLRTHGWGNKDYLIPRFGGTIGTSENWLYGSQGILSFTMELCKTRAPTDPAVVFDYCMKHVTVNLYVAVRSADIETRIIV